MDSQKLVRFAHCDNKETFLEKLAAQKFDKNTIVFIAQEKLIWTQTDLNDDFYDCSGHEALTKTVEELAEAFGLFEKEFDDFKTYVESTFVVDEEISDESTNPVQNKVVKKYIDSKISGKQDTLVSGTNIKTVQGQSILGGGDISISVPSVDSAFSTTSTNAIQNKAVTNELNTKVDKVEGKQLSTEDFTTAFKNKLEGLNNYDDTELSNAVETLRGDFDNIVSGDTTTAIKTFNEIIAFLDGLTDTQDLESIIASIEQQIAGKMDEVTLATVATSGNYNDLSNKPTIPSAVTESTVSGWGFTKNTGTYSKPSGGIPKSDLASAVQTSLGKADTALQSYTEQYKGTVTGVKVNGTTKNPTNGIVDLGTVITSHQDISGKQDKLVSGTNIKTINGTSILGSGDITISGGGSSSGGSGAYAEVNHGTSDTTFTLTPNTFHVWDEVSSLTLTLGSETAGVANEFLFQFTSGATATSLTLPDDIKWANDAPPTIAENMIYQVSILKGMASVLEFANTQISIFYIDGTEYQMDEGMTWEEWVNSKYNIAGFYIEYMPWIDTYTIGIGADMNYGTIPGISKSDLILSGYEYEIYYEN